MVVLEEMFWHLILSRVRILLNTGSNSDFNVLVDGINEGTFTNIESIEFANGDVIATQDLDFA